MFSVNDVIYMAKNYDKFMEYVYDSDGRIVSDISTVLKYCFCKHVYDLAQEQFSFATSSFNNRRFEHYVEDILNKIYNPKGKVMMLIKDLLDSSGSYHNAEGSYEDFDLLNCNWFLAYFRLLVRRGGKDILDFSAKEEYTNDFLTRDISVSFVLVDLENDLPNFARHPKADEINVLLHERQQAKIRGQKEIYDSITRKLKLLLESTPWIIPDEVWKKLSEEQQRSCMVLKRKVAIITQNGAEYDYWDCHIKFLDEKCKGTSRN